MYAWPSVRTLGRRWKWRPSSVPAKPSFTNVYTHRRTAARDNPGFTLSCEIVWRRSLSEKAWMTTRPRANDAVKFGSPESASTCAAGVRIGDGMGVAAGEVAGSLSEVVAGRFSGRGIENSGRELAERAEGYTN